MIGILLIVIVLAYSAFWINHYCGKKEK